MTVEVTADLTMCADCAMLTANGVDPHDLDQRAHAMLMWETTQHWTGHIVVDSQTDEFSARRCDTCNTTDAGARYSGVLLSSASASTVSSAGVNHDQPALPTYYERAMATLAWTSVHDHNHYVSRTGPTLLCETCAAAAAMSGGDPTATRLFSPTYVVAPAPSGIAASVSRFD